MNSILSQARFFLLISLAVCSGMVQAQPVQLSIVTEFSPPFQYLDEKKQVNGVLTAVINETMRRSGYAFAIKMYAWRRAYELTLSRKNTCIYSMAKLPSRLTSFKWVGPLIKSNSVFYAAKSNKNIAINSLDDARRYTTAVIRNDASHLTLLAQGFVEGENLYVVRDTSSMFKLLVVRESLDLILADDFTMSARLEAAGLDINQIQRVFEDKAMPLQLSFACSLNTSDEIVERLSNSLSQLHADGSYDAILTKWQISP
jgi:polar amino acid transport system substrate-binding protein